MSFCLSRNKDQLETEDLRHKPGVSTPSRQLSTFWPPPLGETFQEGSPLESSTSLPHAVPNDSSSSSTGQVNTSFHILCLSDIRKDYNLGPNFDLLNIKDTAKSLPCAVLKECSLQTRNKLDMKQLSRVNYYLKWRSELIISVGKNIPMYMRKARQSKQ